MITLLAVFVLGMFAGMPTGPVEVQPPQRPLPPAGTHIYVIPRHAPNDGPSAVPLPQRYGPAPRVVPVPDPTSPQQGRYEPCRQSVK